MELFSEIYSLYFRAVENLLRNAADRPISSGEMLDILSEGTFSESAVAIFPKLKSGAWPLLHQTEGNYTAICNPLWKTPLTFLQQAWLKALLLDPRIHLFLDDDEISKLQSSFPGVDPLFNPENFHYFDKASDCDDYSDLNYRTHFREILQSIRQNCALSIEYEGGKGNRVSGIFWPYRLEYSQKDDKFRAYCYRKANSERAKYILNVARIISAKLVDNPLPDTQVLANAKASAKFHQVVIEITRERNALERCMVHFAHFEKRTEYDESTDRYTCTIWYNAIDETEVVIRILSFGPTIKVLGPEEFVKEIRARVLRQFKLIRLGNGELG